MSESCTRTECWGLEVQYPPDVHHEGWLSKQGHFMKTWKDQYFVLESNGSGFHANCKISYYKTADKLTTPAGVIPLQASTVSIPHDDSTTPANWVDFSLRIASGKQYPLRVKTEPERQKWSEMITAAVQRHATVVTANQSSSVKPILTPGFQAKTSQPELSDNVLCGPVFNPNGTLMENLVVFGLSSYIDKLVQHDITCLEEMRNENGKFTSFSAALSNEALHSFQCLRDQISVTVTTVEAVNHDTPEKIARESKFLIVREEGNKFARLVASSVAQGEQLEQQGNAAIEEGDFVGGAEAFGNAGYHFRKAKDNSIKGLKLYCKWPDKTPPDILVQGEELYKSRAEACASYAADCARRGIRRNSSIKNPGLRKSLSTSSPRLSTSNSGTPKSSSSDPLSTSPSISNSPQRKIEGENGGGRTCKRKVDLRLPLGLKFDSSLVVSKVETGGQGDLLGIRVGSKITVFANEKVSSPGDFRAVIALCKEMGSTICEAVFELGDDEKKSQQKDSLASKKISLPSSPDQTLKKEEDAVREKHFQMLLKDVQENDIGERSRKSDVVSFGDTYPALSPSTVDLLDDEEDEALNTQLFNTMIHGEVSEQSCLVKPPEFTTFKVKSLFPDVDHVELSDQSLSNFSVANSKGCKLSKEAEEEENAAKLAKEAHSKSVEEATIAKLAEEARLKAEEEANAAKLAEEAHLKAEEEANAAKLAEEARLKAEEEANTAKLAEEARLKAEEGANAAKLTEEARLKAEEEANAAKLTEGTVEASMNKMAKLRIGSVAMLLGELSFGSEKDDEMIGFSVKDEIEEEVEEGLEDYVASQNDQQQETDDNEEVHAFNEKQDIDDLCDWSDEMVDLSAKPDNCDHKVTNDKYSTKKTSTVKTTSKSGRSMSPHRQTSQKDVAKTTSKSGRSMSPPRQTSQKDVAKTTSKSGRSMSPPRQTSQKDVAKTTSNSGRSMSPPRQTSQKDVAVIKKIPAQSQYAQSLQKPTTRIAHKAQSSNNEIKRSSLHKNELLKSDVHAKPKFRAVARDISPCREKSQLRTVSMPSRERLSQTSKQGAEMGLQEREAALKLKTANVEAKAAAALKLKRQEEEAQIAADRQARGEAAKARMEARKAAQSPMKKK